MIKIKWFSFELVKLLSFTFYSLSHLNNSYDKEKAIAALTFICEKFGGTCDKYKLLKILYFAEREHLAKYGRLITGDKIAAIPFGPVPSLTYDRVKKTNSNFEIKGDEVVCLSEVDEDSLSISDIECLNNSVNEHKYLSFDALKRKSHDAAYEAAKKSKTHYISISEMAKAGGASEEMLKYIEIRLENNNVSFDVPNSR
jgi:uncharacterized phage-associated protein